MLAMLKQENQQLQIQQAELMDAMKYQRASLEAKVHDLQRELEQQAFRTPESDESVKRQLEMSPQKRRIWRWKDVACTS